MATGSNGQGRADELSVRPATLILLARGLGAEIAERTPVRVWSMSGVERLLLDDGSSAIAKYAVPAFAVEAQVLSHAARHGVPVPAVLAHVIQDDGGLVMLMDDLGEPVREATVADAAEAAVTIHRCPGLPGRPILDAGGLATLPARALGWLAALRQEGRWLDAFDIESDLHRLARVARTRAEGAQTPPYGMCHSEFHPTSLHVGAQGLRVMDWARAYTGPGLLDLVSWQGTGQPLDLDVVHELIDAYISAGGPKEAAADRGGLPAHVWAAGWDKLWVTEWFMECAFRWGKPTSDHAAATAIGVHLREAAECLAR